MVKCEEKFAARSVSESEDSSTMATTWNVFGAANETTARTALALVLPSTLTFPSGITGYLDGVALKDKCEGSTEDVLTHEATVNYSAKLPKIDDFVEYEFDTSGSETYTQLYALSTVAVTNGRLVPAFNGAINPKSDGTIAGIQAEANMFNFKLIKYWPRSSITTGYQVLLSQFTKRINDRPFGPPGDRIPTGCCRFLGARGKPNGDKWPIEYSFEVRWPETVTIRDMTVIKEGYQHISVYRVKVSDTPNKRTVEVPWCLYIQNVIPKVNFDLINALWS